MSRVLFFSICLSYPSTVLLSLSHLSWPIGNSLLTNVQLLSELLLCLRINKVTQCQIFITQIALLHHLSSEIRISYLHTSYANALLPRNTIFFETEACFSEISFCSHFRFSCSDANTLRGFDFSTSQNQLTLNEGCY